MEQSNLTGFVIVSTPLIGEGNIVDSRSILKVLAETGIPGLGLYPNGLFVRIGAGYHCRMSMSTKQTMDYALHSDKKRSAILVQPLKWELKKVLKKTLSDYPDTVCFITSQSMMAEESIAIRGDIPTIMASSDVYGKYTQHTELSDRQKEIIYLVWNKEALNLYKNQLKLEHVYLIKPIDPMLAFDPMEKSSLPFQFALDEPAVCFIKLSGSGGDPKLVNKAITSLWEKSRVKSIVFPGTEKTERNIIQTVANNIKVNTCLDASAYYHHARIIISHEQMILAYPSEQVKHIAMLTWHNIYPKVAWLPPRGVHEKESLAWAINKGFSGTICIPADYHGLLKKCLINSGVNPSLIECVEPEMLSAEHFKPSPRHLFDENDCTLENIVRKVATRS